MTELLLDSSVAVSQPGGPRDSIRDALMESRQRWQHLVSMTADLAFETDADGRFVFMIPDTVLGWRASALIGQPAEFLVSDDDSDLGFNPFRPVTEVRRQRAWLRRADGRLALITMSATPLHDAAGRVTGARGTGVDMTDSDAQNPADRKSPATRPGVAPHPFAGGKGNRRRQHDGCRALGDDPRPWRGRGRGDRGVDG